MLQATVVVLAPRPILAHCITQRDKGRLLRSVIPQYRPLFSWRHSCLGTLAAAGGARSDSPAYPRVGVFRHCGPSAEFPSAVTPLELGGTVKPEGGRRTQFP